MTRWGKVVMGTSSSDMAGVAIDVKRGCYVWSAGPVSAVCRA